MDPDIEAMFTIAPRPWPSIARPSAWHARKTPVAFTSYIRCHCARPSSVDAAPATELRLAQWQRMYDVNATGVFLACQAEGRAMLGHGRGAIVNIASMSGSIANRGLTQIHYRCLLYTSDAADEEDSV